MVAEITHETRRSKIHEIYVLKGIRNVGGRLHPPYLGKPSTLFVPNPSNLVDGVQLFILRVSRKLWCLGPEDYRSSVFLGSLLRPLSPVYPTRREVGHLRRRGRRVSERLNSNPTLQDHLSPPEHRKTGNDEEVGLEG